MHNGCGGRAQFGRSACTTRAVWMLNRRRRIQRPHFVVTGKIKSLEQEIDDIFMERIRKTE